LKLNKKRGNDEKLAVTLCISHCLRIFLSENPRAQPMFGSFLLTLCLTNATSHTQNVANNSGNHSESEKMNKNNKFLWRKRTGKIFFENYINGKN